MKFLKRKEFNMAYHTLADNFSYFFKRLNPSPTFISQAASQYQTITALIENPYGPARELSPKCFLQGSYKQQTAIYTINDIDIVVLCHLWQPVFGSGGSRSWSRDEIFKTIAAPLLNDGRYRDKVYYHSGSMCIKVDLGIKVEILPVVYRAENYDPQDEPFRLFRVEIGQWEDGYARYHQGWLSDKNRIEKTNGNFIPAIKVFKHMRSLIGVDVVSFHIECLLYYLPDILFVGAAADYIPNILSYIASTSALDWYKKILRTPCGERDIFVPTEWTLDSWVKFHEHVVIWANIALMANHESNRDEAIKAWQVLLGSDFFPRQVS